MADVKLTKNELKVQKNRLDQLQKYLPTLQLKKALLQVEVLVARSEKARIEKEEREALERFEKASPLLSMDLPFSIEEAVAVDRIDVEHENIAGVELPKLPHISFRLFEYDLYTTPAWVDGLIEIVQSSVRAKVLVEYAARRLMLLERELREVTIRVNLFDKVLIPRCKENIKEIRIYLGELQLSQVGQAKVAKAKIVARKMAHAKA